jgi:nucleoside-diphosphate-sugar epimerase
MKILIVGNQGFIGSYLQKNLKCDGMGKEDIADGEWDVVINCAVEKFKESEMFQENVMSTDYVLRHLVSETTKLIHFSSVSIYGDSYYGLTKKMAEDLVKARAKDYCILRMTNVYGSGGDSPANRFENGDNTIFGQGFHIKDHIHIKDVLKAVRLAIKDNWQGEVNLSSGKPATINHIYAKWGIKRPKYLKDKEPAIQISILDNSRALSLGWKPSWSIYNESAH